MNAIVYLIQVNLFLLLFYGFYKLFLRKETFNNLNRGYLVIAAVTAFAVPFLQSDYVRSWFVTQQVNEVIYTAYSPDVLVISTVAESPVLWTDIIRMVYLSIVMLLTIRLVVNILMTNQLFSNFTDTIGGAFSFFGKIIVDESLEEHDTIYRHEEVHSKHLHSADVILFEVIAIICWFNPVVYFYKNAVRNIHEFIADELASKTLNDKAAYATLLVSKQFNIAPSVLTNSFYKPSTIKLRIEMLLKKRSTKMALLKYGLTAPLFLSMVVLASAAVIDKKGLENIAESVEIPLTELPSVEKLAGLTASIKDNEIEGYVTNTNGGVLTGATVTVKGEKVGTITDTKGYFKLITGKGNTQLIVSFIGYTPKEINIDGIAEVKVKLEPLPKNSLDEVMVVGYPIKAGKSQNYEFGAVDEQPTFPGGTTALYKFISERVKYPALARKSGIEGKVFVKFIVQHNGDVSDIQVLKGIGYGCDEESVRVVGQMPQWNPATKSGEPVNAYMTMPIAFTLAPNEDKEGASTGTVDKFPGREEPRNSKLSGDAVPLYVVDGVVVEAGAVKEINPDEIQTVNVMKGAAATALYGKKAADGVIVIVTRASGSAPATRSTTSSPSPQQMENALYIVDDKRMSYVEYKELNISPDNIKSVSVFKDNKATEKYGKKGEHGVIVIVSKKK